MLRHNLGENEPGGKIIEMLVIIKLRRNENLAVIVIQLCNQP
jgi:hypothetical protein